ncbi:DNA-protecting protein DprA [Candidatus Shapirobacteria bacterium]|nr:MAG: DNA-protecting protein DprA [Candidatus Shapirobacteria bacterium]
MKAVVVNKQADSFSRLLRQISDCSSRLYCLGDVSLLNYPKTVAVVGSRQMTDYGKVMVNKIVPELVKNDWLVVSGMALGIDAEAHYACIKAGGKTTAVLASGVDVVSPQANKWIYDLILKKGGLIVSEKKLGQPANRQSFLPRNRIIAGLSQGVLVVEASRRSGTLATASQAAKQGREVMAVPGRVTDKNSGGVNWLIKNGAGVVETAKDGLEILK